MTPKTFCCACDRRCTWKPSGNQNVLSHELQERTAEVLGYPGAEPRTAGRAADERLLPTRADRAPVARVGAEDGAGAGGTESGAVARRDPLPRSDAGARGNPATWIGAFQAAVDGGRGGVRRSALVHPAARRPLPCRRLLSDGERPRRAAGVSAAAERACIARLSEMHDCGLLGRVFPEFQAISWRVVRDFYHRYTVDEHTLLTIRNLERISTTDVP